MAIQLEHQWEASVGDVDHAAIDCTPYLDDGETVSGTPTVVEQDSGDLTISNIAASVAALTILGETVAIGKAIQFTFSGQQIRTTYVLRVSFATSGGRTKTVDQIVICKES